MRWLPQIAVCLALIGAVVMPSSPAGAGSSCQAASLRFSVTSCSANDVTAMLSDSHGHRADTMARGKVARAAGDVVRRGRAGAD
jgi:hypothetical protein